MTRQPGVPDANADDIRLARRRALCWELWVGGMTQRQIGADFRVNLDQSQVSRELKAYREAMPPADRDAYRTRHLDQTAAIQRKLAELAELPAPPVTAGKDGDVVRDPITGDVVRDYSLQRQATMDLLRVQEREAKLMGLDAAAKVEHSGEVAMVDSVNAELARLAEALGIVPGHSQPADGLTEAGYVSTPE